MVALRFRRRRLSVARAPGLSATITLRLATTDDAEALERLAALYDRPLVTDPVLLAFVDDELQAALALGDGRELMEPYRPSAALVDLLALRAEHIREQAR
jgi:hypothetical protein